jgi:hypothetical protein
VKTTTFNFEDGVRGWAYFSDDMKYRYVIGRKWDDSLPRVAFVMLNPSTATERVLDPTIRRCIAYAKRWGFGSYEGLNIFALRSTDPKKLYSCVDPVGRENDMMLTNRLFSTEPTETGRDCPFAISRVIAAWGNHGRFLGRGDRVASMIREVRPLMCLDVSSKGYPKHPLYLRGDLDPRLYVESGR